MNERLKELYQTQIMARAKNPAHFHELPDASHVLEAYNPMCGDQYKLFLKLDKNRIIDASFQGYGCAISKASTELLVQRIIGKELAELELLVDTFLELINPDSDKNIEELTEDQELVAFAGTRIYPEREQCASLSWKEFSLFRSKEG